MNKNKLRKDYERINRKYEVKYFPKVQKAIKSKVSSLISRIESTGIQSGMNYLRTDLTNNKLSLIVNQLYKEVGLRHANESELRLRKIVKKRFGLNEAWIKFIEDFLRFFLIEKIMFKASNTTRDHLILVLQEAIEKGWGVRETVDHLEALPFTRSQAARIVRTEVNRAANVGVKAQGETFEYELNKEWISVHDNRTRGANPEDHADHLRMDGQVVDFYGKFRDPKNGHLLEFPGDPEAEAGDTINCRCQTANVPKVDERGRFIPKRSRITVIRDFNRTQRTITI
jgi:hypothetical protein